VLGSSGCAIPFSENPLTNEETSTLDERLIGYWNMVPKEKDEKPQPAPYVVSRLKDKPNVLQLTYVELDGEGFATVHTVPLYATKIDKEQYLSINMEAELGKKPTYLIFRYWPTTTPARCACQAPRPSPRRLKGASSGTVKPGAQPADDPNKPPASRKFAHGRTEGSCRFSQGAGQTIYVFDEPHLSPREDE
jgi:hypothetical protein